ncbi:hypothetical protein QJQ45_005068 [Haematococcus lacustris]|nr:hypothetical protein QJQ45_005068 [Haematococcus lacustris]
MSVAVQEVSRTAERLASLQFGPGRRGDALAPQAALEVQAFLQTVNKPLDIIYSARLRHQCQLTQGLEDAWLGIYRCATHSFQMPPSTAAQCSEGFSLSHTFQSDPRYKHLMAASQQVFAASRLLAAALASFQTQHQTPALEVNPSPPPSSTPPDDLQHPHPQHHPHLHQHQHQRPLQGGVAQLPWGPSAPASGREGGPNPESFQTHPPQHPHPPPGPAPAPGPGLGYGSEREGRWAKRQACEGPPPTGSSTWAQGPHRQPPAHTSHMQGLSHAGQQHGGPFGGGLEPSQDLGQAPARPGFQTARQQFHKDMIKQGKNPQAVLGAQQAPRPMASGLTRPAKRGMGGGGGQAGGGGGAAGSGNRGGFVPPFVQKAVDNPGGEDGQGAEGPWSERVMSMLAAQPMQPCAQPPSLPALAWTNMDAGPDGQLPEEIEKLDPKIVDMVCNEVLDSGSAVQWADIAGLEVAKKRLQEIIVWPMLNPHLFTGARAPPKGLLLFGPPGTGKTLIGKAIASNISATFFSISASSLTSKWIGEGEKMVRALFTVAACLQPSVIFIDEIDSVLSARKAEGATQQHAALAITGLAGPAGEHEASRRLKTEMLIQMDGCSGSGERRLLVLGATNRPEELDEAARRRMPKQLYIPLPCAAARLQMIQRQLGPGSDVAATLSDQDLAKITAKTQGYSGSDMRFLIQEACQGPVRDAMAEHAGALAQLREGDLRPVMLRDFQMAARVQKASVTASEVVRYEEYDQKHGSKDPNAASDTAAEADEDW